MTDVRAWLDSLPDLRVADALGSGAFGTVWAAEDAALGPVAVKVLPEETDLDRARGQLEAIVTIEHPSLLRLHRLGVHRGRGYVVMERVDGVDLVRAVRPARRAVDPSTLRPTLPLAFGTPLQEGGLSAFAAIDAAGAQKLRRCVAQLASALVALHARGKVHRDVRPENVLVEREAGAHERVVLVDYGLLVDEGSTPGEAEGEGSIAGAPAYMAPDDEIGPAADWYALGVLIFEALTGALPFAGTAHEVIVRKRTVSAPSPSFVVDLPDHEDARLLDALCVKLLRRVAALRPTGEDVLRALQNPAPHTS